MTFPINRMLKAALGALLLVSTTAGAHRHQPHREEVPRPRALFLSNDPKRTVPEVYVAGGVVTTLRFESPCDPSRTRLLGWEGRFEPLLVGGRSVVIVPLRNLDPEDRYLLLVTLLDGSELPFTLSASKSSTDGQVNVYPDPTSPEATRVALEQTRLENQALLDENRRQREEAASVDHAFAALLANNRTSLTPFTLVRPTGYFFRLATH